MKIVLEKTFFKVFVIIVVTILSFILINSNAFAKTTMYLPTREIKKIRYTLDGKTYNWDLGHDFTIKRNRYGLITSKKSNEYKYTTKYKIENNQIKECNDYSKGKLYGRIVYKYNKKGQIVSFKSYYASGKLECRKKFIYKGDKLSKVYSYEKGKKVAETSYTWNGSKIKKQSEKNIFGSEQEIIYKYNGKKIKQIYVKVTFNNHISYETYCYYNSKGYCIRRKDIDHPDWIDPDVSPDYYITETTFKYKYYKNDYIKEITEIDKYGEICNVTKYSGFKKYQFECDEKQPIISYLKNELIYLYTTDQFIYFDTYTAS